LGGVFGFRGTRFEKIYFSFFLGGARGVRGGVLIYNGKIFGSK
jgi:hypothetical protein